MSLHSHQQQQQEHLPLQEERIRTKHKQYANSLINTSSSLPPSSLLSLILSSSTSSSSSASSSSLSPSSSSLSSSPLSPSSLSSPSLSPGYTFVIGPPGSGKSTLLSHVWETLDTNREQKEEKEREEKKITFVHFFGLDRSVPNMLLRLFKVINKEVEKRGGEEIKGTTSVSLFADVPKYLEAISNKGGIIIILDAVDLIENELHWLPLVLLPFVHILISTTKELADIEKKEETKKEEEKDEEKEKKVVRMIPLQYQERIEVVNKQFELAGKSIDIESLDKLLSHELAGNLTFLTTVAKEILRTMTNDGNFNEICNLLCTCLDLPSLFQTILSRWEEKFGHEQTKKVVLIIACSRIGMKETVLYSLHHITTVSPSELHPILTAIRLVANATLGDTLLFNEHMLLAVRQKYSAVDFVDVQRELVTFYKNFPFTLRIAYELPWLLAELVKYDPTNNALQNELAEILLDFSNMGTFVSKKSLKHDLVRYWNILSELNKKWTSQLYIPVLRVLFKKAKKNKNEISKEIKDIKEYMEYAGTRAHVGIIIHIEKQISKLHARAEKKIQQSLHPRPKCYMCREKHRHQFNPGQFGLTLCISCTKKNKEMMDQWDKITTIDECVALVTGARIKIGYYIALRLLRSGATVIAVTRFPYDAALRYSKEIDFEKWKHKLHIYGLDLRHLPSVNQFIAHVLQRYKRIDMLINNAAQTKRRPRAYYHEVVAQERRLMGGELEHKYLVKNMTSDPFMIEAPQDEEETQRAGKRARIDTEDEMAQNKLAMVPAARMDVASLDPSLPFSAALTQVPMHPMDIKERDDEMFPPGLVDEHNEPLDLRPETSWNLKINEVSPVEMLEVQLVNATVPFLLVSAFTPLLKNAAAISYHKRAFIVNVTAVEGLFSYNKNAAHILTQIWRKQR